VSKSTADPLGQAIAQPKEQAQSMIGSIIAPISEIGDTIEGALSAVQPIMDLVGMFGGLLDKPEIEEPITRVYQNTLMNVNQADRADQAIPLALYSGSYLGVDHSALPGGKAWTYFDYASTPSLHSQWTFTATSATAIIPFVASGTPLSVVINSFNYWRSSVRYILKFYCPAFVSARILLCLTPQGNPVLDQVANNLTRVIDVKGDTTDSFTIPFIYRWDYRSNGDPGTNETAIITLQASVLTQIITNDLSVTPSIDMIVFSACGPDMQVSLPIPTIPYEYTYPNVTTLPRRRSFTTSKAKAKKVVKQCDISQEFKNTFAPFVMDCEYFTDSHASTSENPMYITDMMKRYQNGKNNGTPGVYPMYDPDVNTHSWAFAQSFMYCRGGHKVKMVSIDDVNSVRYTVDHALDLTIHNNYTGKPSVIAHDPSSATTPAFEVSVSAPYYNRMPYFNRIGGVNNPTPAALTIVTNGRPTAQYQVYSAARDDFQLGFLVPPPAPV